MPSTVDARGRVTAAGGAEPAGCKGRLQPLSRWLQITMGLTFAGAVDAVGHLCRELGAGGVEIRDEPGGPVVIAHLPGGPDGYRRLARLRRRLAALDEAFGRRVLA